MLFRFFSFLLTLVFLGGTEKSHAQPITWTGASGNESWNDPANWSAGIVPNLTAAVLIDNSSVPGSYRVQLPDIPVTVQSISIRPSVGNRIELLLPVTNTSNDALILTGSGYPLSLGSGAVFRNACGISSGASIELADSFLIENGGRYIHSTRGTHAATLLARLSSSPGTERGIFEFDVPRASYTISVSNRIYGTLALRSKAFGKPVNYTGTGSNPLLVRGDLDIGAGVDLSVDLATAKGAVTVLGDLLQDTGMFTLGSGAGDSTQLQLKGNFMQSSGAVFTSAPDAYPRFEFSGTAGQTMMAAGEITGNVALRINDLAGVTLGHSLKLSAAFELYGGALTTSTDHLLTLGDSCILKFDSLVNGTFVDGPLCRQIAAATPLSIFPVGAAGARRWLSLRGVSGTFTARYVLANPAALAAQTGPGLDHVSSNEYWYLESSGPNSAKVELSHAVPQSGSITDPTVLRVARLQESKWLDAGESAFTGDLVKGSVISNAVTDFSGNYFTLGSSLAMENPLPLELVSFRVWRQNQQIAFNWSWTGPFEAAGYDIMLLKKGAETSVGYRQANDNDPNYFWSIPETGTSLATRWRIDLVDRLGGRHEGKTFVLPAIPLPGRLIYLESRRGGESPALHVKTDRAGSFVLKLFSVSGQLLREETKFSAKGENRWALELPAYGGNLYLLSLRFTDGEEKILRWLR